MNIELSKKQFRRLLDMIYVGNWILNSARGEDRFKDYDDVESLLFSYCARNDMPALFEIADGEYVPSRAFAEGGIHDAIMDYEDTVFFEILAEELARRDMNNDPDSVENYEAFADRINDYITEFEQHGTDNILIDL
jgi:hypothetical protein